MIRKRKRNGIPHKFMFIRKTFNLGIGLSSYKRGTLRRAARIGFGQGREFGWAFP